MYYYLKDTDNTNKTDSEGIKLIQDGIVYFIPSDERNRDYLKYLEWKTEGNLPETEL